jgi:cytochrome c oxidase subunit 3
LSTKESEVLQAGHELRHHFSDMEQQREASTMGMWVFLLTEIMFFGGMFAAYLVYRFEYYKAWAEGSAHMEFWYGTVNTVVLICSSLTMALGVRASQVGARRVMVWLLIATVVLGGVFMVVKGFEYHNHWVLHEFPGSNFHVQATDPYHVEMFFVLYWFMTGFHALHVLIGMALVGTIAYFGHKGKYNAAYHNPVENAGLYWHFVDLVWLYLYPLLYLIAKTHD